MLTQVRGHGEGSIFFRSKDRHKVAAVSLRNGKRPTLACPHRHRPSDRDCPESRANLAELLRLRDARAPLDGHTLTLTKYLQRWLEDVRPNLAPETWRKYESHVRVHIAPALGHLRLQEMSVGDVRSYLRRTGERLDPQTVRHHRGTLRRALADGVRSGLVTRNVAALAEPPKLSHRERPILTAAQVRVLFDGTRDDPLHALWVLAATTGMRLGEMLALTWDDVDLVTGRARIHSTLHRVEGAWERHAPKTEKSRREVILPPVAVEALTIQKQRQYEEKVDGAQAGSTGRHRSGADAGTREEPGLHHQRAAEGGYPSGHGPVRAGRHAAGRAEAPVASGGGDGRGPSAPYPLAARRNSLVFTTQRGLPLHGTNLPKELHKATDRLGLPRVGIHDLRHSAATILFAQGVPIEVIADMLGHSTSRVTSDLYRHRVPELSEDAARRMQEAVG